MMMTMTMAGRNMSRPLAHPEDRRMKSHPVQSDHLQSLTLNENDGTMQQKCNDLFFFLGRGIIIIIIDIHDYMTSCITGSFVLN